MTQKAKKDVVNDIKSTDKYKVALKFINRILVNVGNDEIDDLTKFTDVNRDLIVKDVNKAALKDMDEEIFEHFDRAKCGWYRRNKLKTYIMSFLRYVCDDLGLLFTYEQKELAVTVDGVTYRKTSTMYSIKNKQ